MKYCVDCKHIGYLSSECRRARIGDAWYEHPIVERSYPWFMWWKCGKKGRFWEAKWEPKKEV